VSWQKVWRTHTHTPRRTHTGKFILCPCIALDKDNMVTRDYRPCEKLTWLLSSTGVVELLLHCCSIIVDEKPVDLQVDEARRYRYGVLQRLARSTSSERAVGLGRRMPSMAAAAAAGSTTTSGRSIGAMLTSRFLFSRSRRGQCSLNAGQLHLWFVAQSNTDQ